MVDGKGKLKTRIKKKLLFLMLDYNLFAPSMLCFIIRFICFRFIDPKSGFGTYVLITQPSSIPEPAST